MRQPYDLILNAVHKTWQESLIAVNPVGEATDTVRDTVEAVVEGAMISNVNADVFSAVAAVVRRSP